MLDFLGRVEVGGGGPRLAAPLRAGVGLEQLGGAGGRCAFDVDEGGVFWPRWEDIKH